MKRELIQILRKNIDQILEAYIKHLSVVSKYGDLNKALKILYNLKTENER